MYRSLVRSKLDYGCIIYDSTATTTLNTLNHIATEGLRIISGCFKSFPVVSLYVLVDEMPLQMRRNLLSARYYGEMRSQVNNTAFNYAIPTTYSNLFRNKHLTPPFSIRVRQIVDDMNFNNMYIKPNFLHRSHCRNTPK